MTMFAEPVLASAAEERMEGGAGACRREYAGYHQQHQGAGTPDHLRGAKEGGYPYPEPEDREVRQGGVELGKCVAESDTTLSLWRKPAHVPNPSPKSAAACRLCLCTH